MTTGYIEMMTGNDISAASMAISVLSTVSSVGYVRRNQAMDLAYQICSP